MTRSPLGRALLVLLAFAVVGALLGLLWVHVLWHPGTGTVTDGRWYPADESALGARIGGTATYVLAGLVAGLVLGVLAAIISARAEMFVLVAVLAGSALGAYVMYRVGTHFSAPDPQVVAKTLPDGTKDVPDQLVVGGWSPFLAWPVGALSGLVVTYFGFPGPAPERMPISGLDRSTGRSDSGLNRNLPG